MKYFTIIQQAINEIENVCSMPGEKIVDKINEYIQKTLEHTTIEVQQYQGDGWKQVRDISVRYARYKSPEEDMEFHVTGHIINGESFIIIFTIYQTDHFTQ